MSDSSDPHPGNDEAIEAVAASWLVQQEEGLTPEEAAAFARWREADPRHAAAVAMLLETCGILERMPQARAMLEQGEALAPSKLPKLVAGKTEGSWMAWLIARIALNEAQALIQSQPREESLDKP